MQQNISEIISEINVVMYLIESWVNWKCSENNSSCTRILWKDAPFPP